ncbi:MAG: Rpn family recombination-promoting nuclease/putative transposase [Pseudomonadota bacterium]
MSSTLHQPHDAFFRKSMSDLRVAKDFFHQHLPALLHTQIDWSTLNLQNATFLDEHLKRSAADMLYQVILNGKPAYLYLLCEHTSEPDPQLPFRVVKYIVRIIQQHTDQYPNDPLPIVYPLVLYTGNKPYNQSLDWYELFGEQRNVMQQVFNSPLQLIEVCKIKDPVLCQYLWAGAFEFMFKYRFAQHLDETIIKQMRSWLEALEKHDGFEYTTVMLKYLLNFFDQKRGKKFINELRPYLTPRLEKKIMTIGEQLRYEGMQQGKRLEAMSIARNMRTKGLDPDLIKEITGLAEQDIVEFSE